jgi:hypothetical protein
MKTIKFRVWTGKKMIQPTRWADILIKGDGKLFCWLDIKENSGLQELDKNYKVMQFTGLLDKNRNEIFEGDIVKNKKNPIRIVEWNERLAMFILKFPIQITSEYPLNNIYNSKKYLEIIGNIYENPNLLK